MNFTKQQELLRQNVLEFVKREMADYPEISDKEGGIPRILSISWQKYQFISPIIPREYGGAGADWRFLRHHYGRNQSQMCVQYRTFHYSRCVSGSLTSVELRDGRSKNKVLKRSGNRRNDRLFRLNGTRCRFWTPALQLPQLY